jgi:hypothetical protein
MSDVIALCADPAARAGPLEILSASIAPGRPDPTLLEIEPRPCGWCGLKIDRHRMVDDDEGPEFFCADVSPDDMTLAELERRAELRRQEEVAAILARMDVMDGPAEMPSAGEPPAYRPAASTVDAFWHVVGADDVDRLKAWLAERPKDAPLLLALLESPATC